MQAIVFEKLTDQELVQRWRALVEDSDAPERCELDEYGEVLVTPTPSFWHQYLVGSIGEQLRAQLGGEVGSYAIATSIGVRMPDVCWSESFLALAHAGGSEDPLMVMPPICAEIVSARNKRKDISEKVPAYLAAGVQEVIVVEQDGPIRFFTTAGEAAQSTFALRLQLPKLR